MADRHEVYSGDVMLESLDASYSFSDFTSVLSDYITDVQLKDTTVWKLAVLQFKKTTPTFGIDDADKGWRCEYWGKLMRGACFVYRASRDSELYAILEDTVKDMLTAQDPLGRFSTYSTGKEFNGWDIWGRKYVMLGMIYFLDVCKSASLKAKILSALTKHADYMIERLGREEDGKLNIAKCTSHWDGLNSCSILEPFVFLYNVTKEKRYLDFSKYVVGIGGTSGADLFDIMYENKTEIKDLPQRKAYEMISCFEGLAEYVRITGEEKYRTALKNFADRILCEEVSVIGCCGCDFECFDGTRSSQFDREKQNNVMQETCVTVTWMKFCWQILRMFGDVRYADALEISLYNAFCGAFLTKEELDTTGNCGIPIPVDSYSPLRAQTRKRKMGGRKTVTKDGAVYGCCVAIAAAGFGIASFASACPSHKGAYINLYRSGSITLPVLGEDMHFEIQTDYPADNVIIIKPIVSRERRFTLSLRIPAFSREAKVDVCGESIRARSGYIDVDRTWKNGDAVTLTLDMPIRMITASDISPKEGDSSCVCFAKGPILLAADERYSDPDGTLESPDLANREISYRALSTDKLSCRQAYEISFGEDGSRTTLIDYASAGHGDRAYRMAVWLDAARNNGAQ